MARKPQMKAFSPELRADLALGDDPPGCVGWRSLDGWRSSRRLPEDVGEWLDVAVELAHAGARGEVGDQVGRLAVGDGDEDRVAVATVDGAPGRSSRTAGSSTTTR